MVVILAVGADPRERLEGRQGSGRVGRGMRLEGIWTEGNGPGRILTQCHAVEGDASHRHAREEPEGTVETKLGA